MQQHGALNMVRRPRLTMFKAIKLSDIKLILLFDGSAQFLVLTARFYFP